MDISLLIFIISYPCSSQFIQGTSFLPEPNDGMAVGYDASTDTILLLGGGSGLARSFVTFKDHNFNLISSTYLSIEQQIVSYSQDYSQLGDELWAIRDTGQGFITMNTAQRTVSPFITFPITTGIGACLASVPGYLIVVGGGTWTSALSDTQIYRFSDSQWLSNVPELPSPLMSISCVVVNDKLYVIGGYYGSTARDTIYYLDITNIDEISTQFWQSLSGKLAKPRHGTRAVVHGTDIYVIGGDTEDGNRAADVNVIDTLTGDCSIYDYLPYGTSYAPSIIVDDILYVFGGFTTSDETALYSYKTLPSLNPTKAPTEYPTSFPTKSPTKTPTKNPSKWPTFPTKTPTSIPTKTPTIFPTENPSKSPTSFPTKTPSFFPTENGIEDTSTKSPISIDLSTKTIDIVSTNYTISIEIKECNSDHCDTDTKVDDLKENIIQRLSAEATNTQIIGTEINNDEVIILLFVETNSEQILNADIIQNYIEKEVRDNDDFGVVSVEINKEIQPKSHDRNMIYKLLQNVWFQRITALLISICVMFLLYRVYRYYKQRNRAREHSENVKKSIENQDAKATEMTQHKVHKDDTKVLSNHVQTIGLFIQQQKQSGERDNDVDDDNESLYDVGVEFEGKKTNGENDDDDDDDSELLYGSATTKTTVGTRMSTKTEDFKANKATKTVSDELKEDVILEEMLSDVLKKQIVDPNTMHQMNVNDAIDKKNNDSDSDTIIARSFNILCFEQSL